LEWRKKDFTTEGTESTEKKEEWGRKDNGSGGKRKAEDKDNAETQRTLRSAEGERSTAKNGCAAVRGSREDDVVSAWAFGAQHVAPLRDLFF
jgi:hypothetical protein